MLCFECLSQTRLIIQVRYAPATADNGRRYQPAGRWTTHSVSVAV